MKPWDGPPIFGWSILVPTIPHRHEKLLRLLDRLGEQMDGNVEVVLYRDNLEASYPAKCQTLLEAAAGEYVSFIDDDDLVAPDYIPKITEALTAGPDYVGFIVDYSVDGVSQGHFFHSLSHPGWGVYTRDISHLNPIRRSIALQGKFEGPGHGADSNWAAQVRATGLCVSQMMIDEPLYYYLFETGDCYSTPREPWQGPMPELPRHDWLVAL